MSYNKTTWVDHLKSSNAFNITKNADGTYNITPAGNVIQQGTPMSAENLNNIEDGIADVDNQCAVNRTTLGTQHKNLLKPISGRTRAGITYTVNEDGSVTLTGTSTSGSTYNYFSIPITLKPGKYSVNGMPDTSSNTTYRVDLRENESGGNAFGYGSKEFEVEFTEEKTVYYMIRVDGSYKQPLNGVTFYPMVRYAEIADGTYEPYQPSLQEQISALIARIEALENK